MGKDSVFAKKLREYRGEKTQSEIADILGISVNYYGHLERGLKLPSFEMIKKIIRATGKDANYWLGIESTQEIKPESLASSHDRSLLSIDKMSLDTLSAFFRDRVKHEIDVTRDSTFDRICEDISELYILLQKERKKEEGRIA